MLKKHDKTRSGKSAFVLMDEAIYLLRQAGGPVLLSYYLGSLPFMLGLLYFWSDMSRNPFAGAYVLPAGLALTLAFVWMKAWQAVFAGCLYDLRAGLAVRPPGLGEFCRIARVQAAIQPWGLLLLPLSLLLLFPFPQAYAFFQNCTVLGRIEPGAEMSGQARHLARLWSGQNLLVVWILSPWLLGLTLLLCFALLVGAFWLMNTFAPGLSFIGALGDAPWFFFGALLIVLGLWPAAPLALTLAVNIAALIIALPYLAHSLFGVETIFLRAGIFGFANSTMLFSVYCLTHLLLDPLLKAAYTLRCFYGRSIESGVDILADLKPFMAPVLVAVVLIFGLVSPLPSQAAAGEDRGRDALEQAEPELEQAIEQVLQKREYAWRLPWEEGPESLSLKDDAGAGWLARLLAPVLDFLPSIGAWLLKTFKPIFRWLDGWLNTFASWLKELLQPEPDQGSRGWNVDFAALSRQLALLLTVAAAAICLLLLYRFRHKRRRCETIIPEAAVLPDPSSEETSADQLPENDWLAMAQELLGRNEQRLALRALYLAGLAFLDRQGLITVKPCKSNREYGLELLRRSHALPELAVIFRENVNLFERSWYGDHPVGPEQINTCQNNHQRLRRCCRSGRELRPQGFAHRSGLQ